MNAIAVDHIHVPMGQGALRRIVAAFGLLAFLFVTGCSTSETLTLTAPTVNTSRYAAIVVDVSTGKVLMDKAANAPRYPASLTKMMTLYLLFDALRAGQITTGSLIPISDNAARQPASKLYLKSGDTITVDLAIRALVVKSANDVATAVAEFLASTEDDFARRMTAKAHAIGMRATTFRNASGLPDSAMRTTARDMSLLALALKRNHRTFYGYFDLTSFEYNGNTINGHNKVLAYPGADGLKTGYTKASGFNLATSANRGGKSVVAVVMGGDSGAKRDAHMMALLDRYLRR